VYRKIIAMLLVSSFAYAHEMVPAYPELTPSHLQGISKATLRMFNKRKDVEYYEIGVFDDKFNPVPFVSGYRLFKLQHLGKVSFTVYIRDIDAQRATYVCSKSKVSGATQGTLVSSRICSKFKK